MQHDDPHNLSGKPAWMVIPIGPSQEMTILRVDVVDWIDRCPEADLSANHPAMLGIQPRLVAYAQIRRDFDARQIVLVNAPPGHLLAHTEELHGSPYALLLSFLQSYAHTFSMIFSADFAPEVGKLPNTLLQQIALAGETTNLLPTLIHDHVTPFLAGLVNDIATLRASAFKAFGELCGVSSALSSHPQLADVRERVDALARSLAPAFHPEPTETVDVADVAAIFQANKGTNG
ncbi:MAG: hypothetical protein E6R03_16995 [Hyphomicrobiaceae bacterium]|nr:MAG: hypothetical protein E6R03_16995 [Hyphomicrobiaceae bacterium]